MTAQATIDISSISKHLNPRSLELILLPTEKCNFRCVYCYEDFKLGKMSPRVVNAIKLLIDERISELSNLNISWFGGEPLVAASIVEDISGYAKRSADVSGARFTSGCTTNAYVLDLALLKRLVECGVTDYQVTIDGERDEHDKTRVLASGGPTYDRIMGNLIAAHESDIDFNIVLRLHITKNNFDTIERSYHHMKEVFKNDKRFTFFLKAIENLGGAGGGNAVPDKADVSSIAARSANLIADSERGIGGGLDQYVCYAAKPNSFVIRSDGTVAKCTVIFNSEKNKVGTLADDGRLLLDVDKLRMWMGGFASFDPAALSCPVDGLKLW